MNEIKILAIEDIAELRGCSVRTIKNILWSDKRTTLPPAHKMGRKVFFLQAEVEVWLNNMPIINAPAIRRGRPRKNGDML